MTWLWFELFRGRNALLYRATLIIFISIFFQVGTVTNPTIWLVLSTVQIFLSLSTVKVAFVQVFSVIFFFVWELGVYRFRVGPYSEKLWPQTWGLRQPSIFKTLVTVFHYIDLPTWNITYIFHIFHYFSTSGKNCMKSQPK